MMPLTIGTAPDASALACGEGHRSEEVVTVYARGDREGGAPPAPPTGPALLTLRLYNDREPATGEGAAAGGTRGLLAVSVFNAL